MASYRSVHRADGSSVTQAQIRRKGFPPQTATFPRKTDAVQWAQQVESDMHQRKFFTVFEAQRHTLTETIERFLVEVVPTRPSQRRDFESHLDWWKAEVGAYRLSDLTPSILSSARDKLLRTKTNRGEPPAAATVLRKMASLSAVLKVAHRDWQWIDRSPMAMITKPRAARGRVRFLSGGERDALLAACTELKHPYLWTIVMLALSTGMRLGEIMSLRWELVDVRDERQIGHAQLLHTKNGERRGVAIAGAALQAVRSHALVQAKAANVPVSDLRGLLFPSKTLDREVPMDIRRPWELAVAKADLKDFRFHDLRHSAASYLAMNGATPSEIAEVLGHRTLLMVKRYAHLSQAHTASVVARMNAAVFNDDGAIK